METRKPRQLYAKLFRIYTLIAVAVTGVLAAFFLIETKRNVLEHNQETANRICAETAAGVGERAAAADDLYMEIYRDRGLLEDMLSYLNMEPEEYQRYRLDSYSASSDVQYRGTQRFVTDAFETYTALKRVELVSYKTGKLTACYPQEIVFPYKDGRERLRELTGDGNYGQGEELQFMKELRNPDTMETAGCAVFVFNCKGFFKGLEPIEDFAEVMLTRDYRNLIHSQGNEARLRRILESDTRKERLYLPDFLICRETADDYQAYVILDENKAAVMKPSQFLMIIGVSAASLALGIILIHFYLNRLNNRVEKIVQGMAEVTTGNLDVRLEAQDGGDELDIIAGNFNEMCGELQTYIKKSYLAEIEKKDAQLEALQSQINPHFLYNTLEAIRMKAICNGDREVGKMLYSMSVLFRSQLKAADWITIGQELDYCKQYLELFEYRFQGNFVYKIDCPVELMATKVIKFILQPILENYFVHGIRRLDTDNYIHISAKQFGENVIFCVENNGNGMEPEQIAEKNRELSENRAIHWDDKKSVGISNVNRRIKTVYGNSSGIILSAGKSGGVKVSIKVRLTQ